MGDDTNTDMHSDAYKDYLTDKAKELLQEQSNESERMAAGIPETGSPVDTSPTGRDAPVPDDLENPVTQEAPDGSRIEVDLQPAELKFLARNRSKLSNREERAFLEQAGSFPTDIKDVKWNAFTRWEERTLIQEYGDTDADAIAEELGRDPAEVRLKARLLGIDPQ